jgi:hypothetical protein
MRVAATAGTLMASALLMACGASKPATPASAAPTTCPGSGNVRNATLRSWNHGQPGVEHLVVPGKPVRLLLCRYWGLNHGEESGRLATKSLVRGSAVGGYVRSLDALKPYPEGDGSITCEADNGSRLIAFFRYPDAGTVAVRISLTGCPGAFNGASIWGQMSRGLERMLRRDLPLRATSD